MVGDTWSGLPPGRGGGNDGDVHRQRLAERAGMIAQGTALCAWRLGAVGRAVGAFVCLVTCGLVLAGCGAAPAARAPAPRETPSGALTEALRYGASRVDASAAAGAVVVRGRLLWSGVARSARDPGQVFSLASVTKPYVATLTLRLVDERRLALSDTVGRWLGDDVDRRARRVTVAQLLGHTSGLPDYLEDRRVRRGLRDPNHAWTERELLRAVRGGRPPGSFQYSNTNYLLLGAILRRATDRPVSGLLEQQLLKPLGLRRTALRPTPALAGAVAGGGRLSSADWGELWTDGGIAASAPDVARFFDALLARRRLLRPGTLRRMLNPGPDGSYGLGIARFALGDCRPWGHGGFWEGWSTIALTEPRSQTTLVVLLRGAPEGSAEPVSLALARELKLARTLPC